MKIILLFFSDDDVAPVEIVIPKRKEEIEAERVSEAKKAFAKQLAQMYATMKNDSSRYFSFRGAQHCKIIEN